MGLGDLLVASPGPSTAKCIRTGVKPGVNLSLCCAEGLFLKPVCAKITPLKRRCPILGDVPFWDASLGL